MSTAASNGNNEHQVADFDGGSWRFRPPGSPSPGTSIYINKGRKKPTIG